MRRFCSYMREWITSSKIWPSEMKDLFFLFACDIACHIYSNTHMVCCLWCCDANANANKVVIVILAEFTEPIPSVFQFKHATHLLFDLLLSTFHPKSGIVLAKHHESGIVTTFVCTIWFYYIRFHNHVHCIQNPELSSHIHRWHVQYNEWAI